MTMLIASESKESQHPGARIAGMRVLVQGVLEEKRLLDRDRMNLTEVVREMTHTRYKTSSLEVVTKSFGTRYQGQAVQVGITKPKNSSLGRNQRALAVIVTA